MSAINQQMIYYATASGTGKWYGSRGCFGGGYSGSTENEIDYVAIDTTGDATDFGDLTQSRQAISGTSNGTRGMFMGGCNASGSPYDRTDYITVGTLADATDFGDPTVDRSNGGGVSDGNYAIHSGGSSGGAYATGTDTIDYYTIAITGDATNFGDLLFTIACSQGAVNDATRGVIAGGFAASNSNVVDTIQYITMATTGDATDFGDLTSATANMGGGVDNSVRGVVHYGSGAGVPTIEYITIATTGDATNFGNLTQKRKESGGCNNQTRGIWGGGKDNSAEDIIDYITIDTTGDATDFGDLTQSKQSISACSGT